MLALLAAVVIAASIVTMLSAFVPIVVDVVVKDGASSGLKSAVLLVVVAALELIEGAVDPAGAAVLSVEQLAEFAFSTIVAMVAFFTGWKPSGISDTVQTKTATFGIGSRAIDR